MTNFTSSFFTNGASNAKFNNSAGRSIQFTGTNFSDLFLQKAKGNALRREKLDPATGTLSTESSFSHFPATLGPIAGSAGFGLAAAIDFDGSPTDPDRVNLYDFSNPSAPLLYSHHDFPTNEQPNPEFAGQVIFSGRDIWALDANNGLMGLWVNGPRFLTFYTAVPARLGNNEIIRALIDALHTTNDLTGAKLLLKTTGLGTTNFTSAFILRKDTNDVDVSSLMPLPGQPAAVSAETPNAGGTLTNATDYAVTTLTLKASPLIRFDGRGLGVWKSSSLVDRGKTIMASPFLNSLTISSLDGVAFVQGISMVFHGSAAITGRKIEIVPNRSPTVSLSSPTNSQSFSAPGDITLRANASDPDGRVALVEFFQDGVKLGERAATPYTFTWTNAPAGTFSLYAQATDNDGVSVISATNTITINPGP
jgi:hypothetical protein